MSAIQYSLPAIEYAIRDVCVALDETERAATCWSRQSEDDLWRELVSCILGSRVRFEAVHAAVERMTTCAYCPVLAGPFASISTNRTR